VNLVEELLSTFRPPNSPKMIERMEGIARKIPERFHEEIFQAILEEEGPNIQIGVSHIVAACERIGAPYTKAHYIPTEDWICDSCGFRFKYHPAPSDDDKIDKDIHDVCPNCGLQVCWTKTAEILRLAKIGIAWYDKLKAEQVGAFGPQVAAHKKHIGPMGAGLTLTRGGLYWARHLAERERAEDRRINAEGKIADIDRAKRWDIEKDIGTPSQP
jgi:hypothetical protein